MKEIGATDRSIIFRENWYSGSEEREYNEVNDVIVRQKRRAVFVYQVATWADIVEMSCQG